MDFDNFQILLREYQNPSECHTLTIFFFSFFLEVES